MKSAGKVDPSFSVFRFKYVQDLFNKPIELESFPPLLIPYVVGTAMKMSYKIKEAQFFQL